MLQFEGFLLLVAFFMGNIVPIVLNIFIWKTLKLQATQSATGLLYISVLSILFGDLLYKYYLLRYGFLLWIDSIAKFVKRQSHFQKLLTVMNVKNQFYLKVI